MRPTRLLSRSWRTQIRICHFEREKEEYAMAGIQLGAPYTFVPSAFIGERSGSLLGQKEAPRKLSGRITYINWAHRYFTVTAEVNDCTLRESFKF